jgi:hypothetical protein
MIMKYLRTIIYSFYSASAYIDVFKNWRGYGLKYILIVTTILSAFIVLGWSWQINKINPNIIANNITDIIISEPNLSFEDNINRFLNILSQIPEMELKDGSIKILESQPYSITDPVSGEEIAIIDTTGSYTSLENTSATFLLTETKMIILDKSGQENIIYLHDIKKRYNIDEDSLNETMFIISQIPAFGLRNGRVITQDNKLYKILDKKDSALVEIGADARLNDTMEPMMAISTDEISYKSIFNKKGKILEVSELNEQKLFDIILSGIQNIRKLLQWGAPIIALPFVILTSFLFNCLMLVFYSFIGYSFIKITKLGQFEFIDIMRVSAVAITPMLLLSTLLPHIISSQGTVYFIISIGYLYFAVKNITALSQK